MAQLQRPGRAPCYRQLCFPLAAFGRDDPGHELPQETRVDWVRAPTPQTFLQPVFALRGVNCALKEFNR